MTRTTASSRTRKTIVAAGIAAAGLMLLAACGSVSDQSDSPGKITKASTSLSSHIGSSTPAATPTETTTAPTETAPAPVDTAAPAPADTTADTTNQSGGSNGGGGTTNQGGGGTTQQAPAPQAPPVEAPAPQPAPVTTQAPAPQPEPTTQAPQPPAPSVYTYVGSRDIASLVNPQRIAQGWAPITNVAVSNCVSSSGANVCGGHSGACGINPNGIGTATSTIVRDGQYKDQYGNCIEVMSL